MPNILGLVETIDSDDDLIPVNNESSDSDEEVLRYMSYDVLIFNSFARIFLSP